MEHERDENVEPAPAWVKVWYDEGICPDGENWGWTVSTVAANSEELRCYGSFIADLRKAQRRAAEIAQIYRLGVVVCLRRVSDYSKTEDFGGSRSIRADQTGPGPDSRLGPTDVCWACHGRGAHAKVCF